MMMAMTGDEDDDADDDGNIILVGGPTAHVACCLVPRICYLPTYPLSALVRVGPVLYYGFIGFLFWSLPLPVAVTWPSLPSYG